MSERALPRAADIVIVGGGILGLSIAWHLARAGGLTVVTLDRQPLASQASSRAAALLSLLRMDDTVTRLVQRTFSAITELATCLGEPLPLHRNGSLHVATTDDGRRDLMALTAAATRAGVALQPLSAAAACRLVPWLSLDEAAMCVLCSDDAFIDPYLLATAYGTAARRSGATILSDVAVTGLSLAAGRIVGVTTTRGPIAAATVVLAAGAWSNVLAATVGARLPMAPVRSQYWITTPDRRFPRDHPSVLLAEAHAYTRPEVGALLFGLREPEGFSLDPRALPTDIADYPFAEDASGIASLSAGGPALSAFLPALAEVGIRAHVAGFSTYTPDGLPAFGAIEGIPGLLFAAGCCGAGIAISGGVGLSVAELATGRSPSLDIRGLRCDRFGAFDPFDAAFLRRCAAVRANKRSG